MNKYLKRLVSHVTQMSRRWQNGIQDSTIKVGRRMVITDPLKLGNYIDFGDYTRIRGAVSIGSNTSIRSFALLDARGGTITIGSHCSINDYCVLYGMGNIQIGNDVRIAAHSIFVSGNHIIDDISKPIRLQGTSKEPIVVGDNVWIGANVCVLGNVTIGSGSVIGAGAVVTSDIPPMSIAVGNPARVIGDRRNRASNVRT
jgi:acetyltransferase-like isoleucine patch superfamily enzyme